MKISFLGQGFEDQSTNAIGNYLMRFFGHTGLDSFTGISAFASEAGIFGLSVHLMSAKHFKSLTLIVGVDQDGTSKEALEEILNLKVNSYVFYQPEQPIFHPKIYLFEGPKEIKLIVGSSNLTARGLFTNVESSLLIEFDTNDKEGLALLSDLKTYYKSLFDFKDPNLFPISTGLIADFVSRGIVPDEVTRSKSYAKKTSIAPHSSNLTAIPKRKTPKVPSSFPKKPRATTAVSRVSQRLASAVTVQPVITIPVAQPTRILVWQKQSLSQSDAQNVPHGTKITANLKLSQARFKINNVLIDQKIYFRNQIFNHLTWVKTKANSNSYEEAFCSFEVTILGNPVVPFTLKLSHDPVRIASQGNTPTWLHWGNSILPLLQQNNITGRTLNLFQSNQTFAIEII